MGSIPPAASIEHPQREIVQFIADNGIGPNAADLRQLSKGVQSGQVNFVQDGGTPNFIAVTPNPPLTYYGLGMYFRIKVMNNNTGPTQINLSNLGWYPVVHADGTPMGAGELLTGQMIEVAFDGAHWQMITGGLSGSLINLTSIRSFYVNAATGQDTYDGTQPVLDATGTHGPFLTLKHALQQTSKYNLAGFQFNIYMAPGIYASTERIDCPIPNGSGSINIIGLNADGTRPDPSSCKITNAGNGSCIHINGGFYTLDCVSLESTHGGPGDNGDALWVSGAGGCWLYHVAFWNSASHHILAAQSGQISMSGPIDIYGSGLSHISASQNGNISMFPAPPPTLNIVATCNFTWFCTADTGGQCQAIYSAINGFNNVTGGAKFLAVSNGVINTFGHDQNYLPGFGGAFGTGGQYV
jgi:hypothetical protein